MLMLLLAVKQKICLFWKKKWKKSQEIFIFVQIHGSYGHAGMVTSTIEKLVKEEGKKYDVCVAIGPMIMMKFVCLLTKQLELPTIVSKSNYGRRNRYVWCLSSSGRR